MTNRLLVLGLDSATFDLIGPWADQGLLPNFSRLMSEGAWGQLESTMPPVTAVAWNAFATGKNPGKFGVFDFVRREADGYAIRVVNGGDRKAMPFWRILDRRGLPVGVINVPMTYPPDRLAQGFVVSGFDAPGFESDFVYPPQVKETLRKLRYVIHPTCGERKTWARGLFDAFSAQSRAFWELYHTQPWDVLVMVFMQLDVAQHLFWHEMEQRDALFGDVILNLYRQADAMLGQALGALGANDVLIAVSDHGAGPLRKAVSINQWLLREGFLCLRQQGRSKRAINQTLLRVFTWLNMHLPKRAKTALKRRLAWVRDEVESHLLTSRLDWSKTRAFALGEYGGIFINLSGREAQGIVAPLDYDRVRDEIAAKLLTLRDPEGGEQVIRRVLGREELYEGPYVQQAPDLILDWNYAYDCRERVGSEHHDVFESDITYKAFADYKKTGVHRLYGVLLMYGPCVRPGRVTGARLIDIAPTLLHVVGVPVPKDMDGRVLVEAFQPQWLAQHPIVYEEVEAGADQAQGPAYDEAEEAQVEERLRALGYLD